VLTSFDDYPVHQTALPIAHAGGGHPDYYDRFWFNGYTEDYYFAVALGLYPNRGVIDAAFGVVHDGWQRSVFASGRMPLDPTQTPGCRPSSWRWPGCSSRCPPATASCWPGGAALLAQHLTARPASVRWVPQPSFASSRFGSVRVKYAPLATYTVEPRTAMEVGFSIPSVAVSTIWCVPSGWMRATSLA
jgi:hypothetical protein